MQTIEYNNQALIRPIESVIIIFIWSNTLYHLGKNYLFKTTVHLYCSIRPNSYDLDCECYKFRGWEDKVHLSGYTHGHLVIFVGIS